MGGTATPSRLSVVTSSSPTSTMVSRSVQKTPPHSRMTTPTITSTIPAILRPVIIRPSRVPETHRPPMHVIFQDGQVYCGNQLDWRGCTAVRMTASMNWAGRIAGHGGTRRHARTRLPGSVALHAETDRPVHAGGRDFDSPVAGGPGIRRHGAGVIQVSLVDDAAAGVANDQRATARRKRAVLRHRGGRPVVPPRVTTVGGVIGNVRKVKLKVVRRVGDARRLGIGADRVVTVGAVATTDGQEHNEHHGKSSYLRNCHVLNLDCANSKKRARQKCTNAARSFI